MSAFAATLVQAASVAAVPAWRADCVGYHTLSLPGDIEYAVAQRRFSDRLPVWGNSADVMTDKDALDGHTAIGLVMPASIDDLNALMGDANKEQQKKKKEFLEQAKWLDETPEFAKDIDPDGRERRDQREKAGQVPFYQPIPNHQAFGIKKVIPNLRNPPSEETEDWLEFQVLLGNRIVSTSRKLSGTPQEVLERFLSHYRPREPFEVPTGPGVCLAYAAMNGEVQPATVGVSIRLKDRPDIVVYLRDTIAGADTKSPDTQAVLKHILALDLYATQRVDPMNKLRPTFERVTLAGHEGLGAWVQLTRDPSKAGSFAVHNEANKNRDWAYVAFVPGDKSAPVGQSSDLTLRIERYGRFAKKPMSEKEFRELASAIAASIQRRPGAWVAR